MEPSTRTRYEADFQPRRAANSGSPQALPLWVRAGAPVLIAAAGFVAYLPALENDFVDWDDPVFLTQNYNYRGLSGEHLYWMFTEGHQGHYQPLSWISYAIDYRFWKMDPKGYHLTNMLFHAVNGVLVYLLAFQLLRLTLGPPERGNRCGVLCTGATIAALVFAVHPMRVESVAWATERRDVLSGFFYLMTVWLYVRACTRGAEEKPRWGWLMLCWLLSCAALLSKVMCVSLPFVLMILDVYPLRRVSGDPFRWFSRRSRRVWLEKAPMLLAAVAAAAIAPMISQRAMSSLDQFSLLQRLAISGYGYAFYLYKMVWPVVLLPLYEMPVEVSPGEWPYVLSAGVVLGITILLFTIRKRLPGFLAVWAAYLVILLPVIGLVQVGPQIAADRYSYLSCVGWAILAGGGVSILLGGRFTQAASASGSATILVLCSAVILALAAFTWKQTRIWKDSETLWSHVLEHDRKSSRAHNGLGYVRQTQGRPDEAMELYRKSIELRPRLVNAHVNLGAALREQGDVDAARETFAKALEIFPDSGDVWFYVAQMRADAGDADGAIAGYREAVGRKPDSTEIHTNLGIMLAAKGEFQEAAEHLRRAIRLNPDGAEAHSNLGVILRALGRLDEAETVLRRAVELSPDSARPHKNLGDVYGSLQEWDLAIRQYERAIEQDPMYAGAHFAWGRVLQEMGAIDEAIMHFQQAADLDPDSANMRDALERAVRQAGH